MLIGSPRILALGISQHLTNGAATSRHIPHGARHLVQHHRALHLRGQSHLLQGIVTAVDHSKQTVGTLLATQQHAIETHPLSTCQGRGFHILGTLDEGDVNLLHLAIATTILKRRQEDSIRALVDDFFYHRTHAVATIADATFRHLLVDIGYLDVFQVGHSCYALLLV